MGEIPNQEEEERNKQFSLRRLLMMKNIRISNLVYEMLVTIGKKHKPSSLKPEVMLEELIESAYRNTK